VVQEVGLLLDVLVGNVADAFAEIAGKC